MSDVPPEVLVGILSRLPVKSLLRFRCVSKPWRSLLDGQYFIKQHLNHSIKANTNLTVILSGNDSMYSIDFHSSPRVAIKDEYPLKCYGYMTVVLGSCNGLLCLSTTAADNEIALWNPSTRMFKKLPLMPVLFSEGFTQKMCIEGFGYDYVNDDYKVVNLLQSRTVESELVDSKLSVYSLKSNSWQRVKDFPYYICYKRHLNAYAGGALHWVVSRKPDQGVEYLIGAFDLGTEECRLVPQPEYSDKHFSIDLAALGGCLCVVCNKLDSERFLREIDLWVMKDYGVKESWTKLISISRPDYISSLEFVRPIAFSKRGWEVLLEHDGERFSWYDVGKKMARNIDIHGMPDSFIADVYGGTLVQLNGGSACGSGTEKTEQAKEKKKMRKKDDFLSKGFKLVL